MFRFAVVGVVRRRNPVVGFRRPVRRHETHVGLVYLLPVIRVPVPVPVGVGFHGERIGPSGGSVAVIEQVDTGIPALRIGLFHDGSPAGMLGDGGLQRQRPPLLRNLEVRLPRRQTRSIALYLHRHAATPQTRVGLERELQAIQVCCGHALDLLAVPRR